MARTLFHYPIIHGQEDLGAMEGVVAAARSAEQTQRHGALLDHFWTTVEDTVAGLDLDWSRVRLYQDGLPLCGRENDIVAELAAGGSRNHRLLQTLMDRGATLMGTESAELLVREYELMKKQFLEPGGDAAAEEGTVADLLVQRDAFIGQRINETLQPGESGMLFLGLTHTIEGHLDADVVLRHPLGKPKISDG